MIDIGAPEGHHVRGTIFWAFIPGHDAQHGLGHALLDRARPPRTSIARSGGSNSATRMVARGRAPGADPLDFWSARLDLAHRTEAVMRRVDVDDLRLRGHEVGAASKNLFTYGCLTWVAPASASLKPSITINSFSLVRLRANSKNGGRPRS